MLKELHLDNVGPAPKFNVEFGPRLNLFTGDNGLGKTFLLDIVWWALTRTWVNHKPMLPDRKWPGRPQIAYRLAGDRRTFESRFYYESQRWSEITGKFPADAGLVIYMRVDDGFSVWDPFRSWLTTRGTQGPEQPKVQPYHFTLETLWNGLVEDNRTRCKGLIADWVNWQYQPDQEKTDPFPVLKRVIEQLSPHPDEWLEPGKPTRVSIDDVRDIPTINLPYGNIPVTDISAGMKRILSLAYLLIWTWYEHTQASKLLQQEPTDKLILLVDEVESHLHPQWQRSLLPAVLELGQTLQPELKTQIMATTHAPLVLASVEPYFKDTQDRLFLFELRHREVNLSQIPWAKQGDTVGWLTSEIFGLKQARAKEAEQAIEAAEALMRGEDMSAYPQHLRTKEQIDGALRELLPGHDPFWPRWVVEMEMLPAPQKDGA